MRMTLIAAGLVASLLGVASSAAANATGYPCLIYNNGSESGNSYGDGGYIIVGMYSDASCSNFISYEYFCSTNATNSRCSSYSNRSRSEVQQAMLFSGLLQAQNESHKVTVYEGSCMGSGSGCAYQVLFWSDDY